MIEALAMQPGRIVLVEQMANAVWPAKWPADFKHRLEFLMVSVRKALPNGFVTTEYQKPGRHLWPRTRDPLIGWRLCGAIQIEGSR